MKQIDPNGKTENPRVKALANSQPGWEACIDYLEQTGQGITDDNLDSFMNADLCRWELLQDRITDFLLKRRPKNIPAHLLLYLAMDTFGHDHDEARDMTYAFNPDDGSVWWVQQPEGNGSTSKH